MSIYVIGDLHLSFSVDKPMDIFGNNWENHAEKIKTLELCRESWKNYRGKYTENRLIMSGEGGCK